MFLLRFTFENHRSFRESVDLTMVLPTLKTNVPTSGSWLDHTSRVAAVYGPNASGKSGVLDALKLFRAAVANSASSWNERSSLPRKPFALDEDSRKQPSTFVLDFVLENVRYEYGFTLVAKRFKEEWLYSFPTSRKRMLFERGSDPAATTFGREFGAGGPTLAHVTEERELVLSNGPFVKHPLLTQIHDAISNHIDVASFGESDRQNRLRSVLSDVANGDLSMDDLRTMLRVADIGIMDAEIEEEEEADPEFLRVVRSLLKVQRTYKGNAGARNNDEAQDDDGSAGKDDDDDEDVLSDDELERMYLEFARRFMFKHTGADERGYALPSSEQSTGTLTWLSLAAPAISVIRTGGVLAVDELDASLHPQLAEVMIQMFRDPGVNRSGAQLIFTTHDTYFMSPTSDARLAPEEVWFVEKDRRGVSELYRLSEFPTRRDQNLSRRYLQGRYGAVPSVAPSFLAAIASYQPDELHEPAEQAELV